MISKVATVRSSSAFNIKTLNDYLRLGHKDEPKLENERVINFFTLNMYADDLETATQEMMYTASLNTRSKCSKYIHLVLSLSEGEKSDLDTWKKIINDYVKEVGMKKHQVIAVQHNDNGKEHFHIIINRIDTEKHTRVNDYKLYYKLQKFDEKIEEKYSLKQFDHKSDQKIDYQQSALNHAKDIEKKSEHQPFLSYLLEHKDDILKANSWKELQEKLAQYDCCIKVKGRGLVIKSLNPEHKDEAKASSFDRNFSYSKLVKKWGLPPSDLNNEPEKKESEKKNKNEFKTVNSEPNKDTFTSKPLTKNAKRIEYTAYFFLKIKERKDLVIDKGNRLIVKKHNDPRTLYDTLKIAKKRFGNGHIRINGDRKFQLAMMNVAMKMNIDVKLSDPILQREYELKFTRLRFEQKQRIEQERIKYNSLLELELQRKKYERENRRNQQHSKSGRNSRNEERSQQPDFHR